MPLTSEDEQRLFDDNMDNQKDYENRTIKDEAEKFSHSLLKRHLRSLLVSYDYQAAEKIINQKQYHALLPKKDLSRLRNLLNDFVKVFKNQGLLSEIQHYPLSDVEKKALNYFLMIEVLKERGQVADVLIKSKSFVEFILEEKIKEEHPDLIKFEGSLPKLNEEYEDFENLLLYLDSEFKQMRDLKEVEEIIYPYQSTLNLLSYTNILSYYQASPDLLKSLSVITNLNGERNKVAHGLSEIDSRLIGRKKMNEVIAALRNILQDSFAIDNRYFNYYQEKNEEMLTLLRK